MAKLSLNRTEIIGNLGKDCELRYTAGGTPRGEFTVAASRSFKKGNEWQEETEWFNVVLWGDEAERLSESLLKGQPVYVEGRMQTRNWDGNDGVKHYRTELVANSVHLLVKPPKREARPAQAQEDTDDIPFE
ncbi:MAG: single-stranded DNA-binding protein [Flavobacteriales bacterium]|nr:single-stranded DNA-binding protein [Flavobacteriales bacterium]